MDCRIPEMHYQVSISCGTKMRYLSKGICMDKLEKNLDFSTLGTWISNSGNLYCQTVGHEVI
jgi:hypothetical protein